MKWYSQQQGWQRNKLSALFSIFRRVINHSVRRSPRAAQFRNPAPIRPDRAINPVRSQAGGATGFLNYERRR
jgi:hypothetical protein